jgi:hypothetical protein
MVRKLDLHEDAIFRHCGSAVEIMGFEYAESARPIPVLLIAVSRSVRKVDRTENTSPRGPSERDGMPTLRGDFSNATLCYARLRRER